MKYRRKARRDTQGRFRPWEPWDLGCVSQKGGKARAEALEPSRRTEIARKAAQARWAKRRAS